MTRITDGHGTIVNFLTNGLTVKHKNVTPPGQSVAIIDTTVLEAVRFRQKQPGQLVEIGDISATFTVDPVDYDTLLDAAVGVNQQIEVVFPAGDKITIWGFLQSWEPSEFAEGTEPTISATIVVSNTDGSGDEAGPAYTAAA